MVEAASETAPAAWRSPGRLWWYLIGAFAAAIYIPTFRWLVETWWNDRFYGHGLLVAGVCGWLAHRQWETVLTAPARPSRWGIPLVVVGLLAQMVSAISDVATLSALSLYPVGVGLLLATRGPGAVRALRFPIL